MSPQELAATASAVITALNEPVNISRELGSLKPFCVRGITRQSRSQESFMTQSAPSRDEENDLLGTVNGIKIFNGLAPLFATHYVPGGLVGDFGEESTIWLRAKSVRIEWTGLEALVYRDMRLKSEADGYGELCPVLSTIPHPNPKKA